MYQWLCCLAAIAAMSAGPFAQDTPGHARPNVLFIAIDDLNDWVGVLGGHPQARTPNLDRLAASGVLFTNAYCPAASCNPSRSAIMTGIPPHRSGLYDNRQKMRRVLPKAELMPRWFTRNGYWAAGSGKILHYFIDAASWDDYFPAKEKENPFPRTLYPKQRPVSLPREPWMYVETDWGPLDVGDEEFGGDWLVSKWIGEQLGRKHDKPFFLACGLYRPHEPWFVPKKYFDAFPLDSVLGEVQMPPGLKENDLADVPPLGKRLGRNRYLAHIRKHGQWRAGVRAYLAAIAFADAMLGRVLGALDRSPHRDNTIVVLWSDHGWHLGEKEHWQKFTGWRACARVPLVVRVPKGSPGLPAGTTKGGRCSRPVSLVDLFATLNELCGLPEKDDIGGHSLVALLRDPKAPWPHAALTHFGRAGNYAISTERWRYIHYFKGGEELYDIESDPYEWTNLAHKPEHRDRLAAMRALVPDNMKPKVLAAKPEQWIPLFNGKNLDGWKVKIRGFALGDNHKHTFRVEDGLLRVAYDEYDAFKGKFGHLFFETPFSNYRLRLEYRFTGEQCKGGPGWAFRNSGIMVHGQSPESMRLNQDFPVSIEVQLLGGRAKGKRPTANLCTPGTNVVLNDKLTLRHCINSTSKTYRGDQWVKVEVEVRGNKVIRHLVDGKVVLEYTKPQLDDRDKDARALIKDGKKMLSGGSISLQSESHAVDFRNIELLPLGGK